MGRFQNNPYRVMDINIINLILFIHPAPTLTYVWVVSFLDALFMAKPYAT